MVRYKITFCSITLKQLKSNLLCLPYGGLSFVDCVWKWGCKIKRLIITKSRIMLNNRQQICYFLPICLLTFPHQQWFANWAHKVKVIFPTNQLFMWPIKFLFITHHLLEVEDFGHGSLLHYQTIFRILNQRQKRRTLQTAK